MRFELVKDVIFKNEKIHPILATMDDDTKDAFFSHFYYYPTPFTFIRAADKAKFEKKVLDILSNNPGPDHYLFLRSSTFLNNKELWKKDGIDSSEDEIKTSYRDYSNRHRIADKSLGKYYIISTDYDSKILANKYTHQLYHLIKTVEVSGLANGQGFSLIPLMVKYEDAYETPIEEHETWYGEFWNYQRMLEFSILFFYFISSIISSKILSFLFNLSTALRSPSPHREEILLPVRGAAEACGGWGVGSALCFLW